MALEMTLQMTLSLCFLVLLSGCYAQSIFNCNQVSGPAGLAQCVDIPRYDHPQWAVCLTDAYIMAKSMGQHACVDRTATYCWYQCQVELFDGNDGPVNEECRCTVGETPPEPSDSPSDGDDESLEEWCFSPDGTACNWYRECLEKKHPCEQSENGYALTYAEKFCELYTTRYNFFTAEGQQWVDATRKCLQVALVPLLRPWQNPTCAEIRSTAFDSHSDCYLNPGPGAPSICDLGCYDWAQIFWTIKGGFTQVFVDSLKGTVEVMLGCGNSFRWFDDNCPSVILNLALVATRLRGKRASEGITDEMAGEITSELAKKLKWDPRVMDWFAFTPNTTEDNNMEINIILGNKIALDLTEDETSNVIPQFSLEKVVQEFGESLEEGLLYDLNVDGQKISVSALDVCQDSLCEETFLNTTAGPRPPTQRSAAPGLTAAAFPVSGLLITSLAVLIHTCHI